MSKVTMIGIDVGAQTLVWAQRRRRGEGAVIREATNTPAGRHVLIGAVARLKPVRVVLEATGTYFLDLACELVVAGAAVMVVNPKAAHHFAEAELRRRKDDPIDATGLLVFGERMPWRPWTPPSPAQSALRSLARQSQAFTKQLVAAKNQRHAAAATRLTPAALLQALDDHIAHLEAMIAELRHAAQALVAHTPDLARRCDLADRLPGVDRATALALTAELGGLPDDMTARQWTAQAGLDVREERSGTSLRKQARISKRGNARVRAALYYPAMSAVRCCPQAKRFHDRLTQAGLAKRQALTAVMRKLLHGLHALWKTGEAFDPDRLFPAVQPENT